MKKLIYFKNGFSILVVLLMMSLLAITITVAFSGGDNSVTVIANSVSNNTMAAQASLIRARILSCAVENPTGNNGTNIRISYPGATSAINASSMICPGLNVNIWTTLDGVVAPVAISGFSNWQYVNDSISIRISTLATSQDRINALPALVSTLGSQAYISGGNTLVWIIVQ